MNACPCGRLGPGRKPLAYAQCCGRYIDHYADAPAPDAESLMRSRYTAFVREDAAYLLATWHPGHRPDNVQFDPGTRWLGLEVRGHWPIDATRAEVAFVARYRSAGRGARIEERSSFVRESGRWYYTKGSDPAGHP